MDTRYENSVELFRRATRVIPGGIYGFKNPIGSLPGVGPYYTARAAGSRFWDVDGNEYIEYGMGLRAVALGHAFPPVVDAVQRRELCRSHRGVVHRIS